MININKAITRLKSPTVNTLKLRNEVYSVYDSIGRVRRLFRMWEYSLKQ